MRAIDADALIKSIDGNPFTTDSVKSYIHASVAKMPTIKPERKKGRWIEHYGMNHECSECKQFFPLSFFDGRPFEINFCPNCGADLRGDNDD